MADKLKARIAKAQRKNGELILSFDGDIVINDVAYPKEEYKRFKESILKLVGVKLVSNLVGLRFEYEIIKNRLYPTTIILLENPIRVDYREPASIFEALLPLSTRDNLDHGDYTFKGYGDIDICIERKEVGDLISSILNNHLSEQVRRMSERIKILMVEGFITCTQQLRVRTKYGVRKVNWNFIWNHLQTLQNTSGITLDFSSSTHITALRIKSLYKYYQKEEHVSGTARESPSYPSNLTDREKVERLLCVLPSISEIRCNQILENFHSYLDFLNAPREEKLKVKGLGPVIVDNIDRLVRYKV